MLRVEDKQTWQTFCCILQGTCTFCTLKGHCHGDFAMLLSKWLKYLTKNLFSNMKLLLEHREGNIKGFI